MDVRLNFVSEVGSDVALDVGSEGKETRQIIFIVTSENGSSRDASASKK